MADFIPNSAILGTPGRSWARLQPPRWRLTSGKMAELLMNSAIVESGPMPTRDLPHYWTPEQAQQILAAMPVAQPWLFPRLTG